MLNCTTGLLPCVFEGRNCTQFPYITSQSSVSWRIALWDCLETSLPLCLMNLDLVSLRNFAVVGVVANCTMGLFGDVITSLLNEFGPSFPTQLRSCRYRGELHHGTVWRRYYFFDRPFPHLPWGPETFLALFPVSVWLRASANTKNSRCTRQKPLVPRVSRIPL